MNSPLRLCFFSGSILVLLVLWGCTGAASTPQPTVLSNPTALTKTVPPTSTSSLPVSGTAANDMLPPEISAAFSKTRAAQNVRYEISSEFSFIQDGKQVKPPGLQARGEESGANHHLAISGIMNATGETATFEFVTLEGVTYIKGLSGIPGVDPTQWYIFPKELGNVTRDAPGVKALLADLAAQNLDRGNFQTAGTETVDGQACTVWSAQNPKLAQSFIGIANNRDTTSQLQTLDKGEFRMWTCADGYIHRITGAVWGHDASNPNNQANMQLTFHIFDHDAPITITAPAGAQEFQLPVQGTDATPTP